MQKVIVNPEFRALIPQCARMKAHSWRQVYGEADLWITSCSGATSFSLGTTVMRSVTNMAFLLATRIDFSSRNKAKLWMLQSQLARRNLTDMQRIDIVRKCESAIKARAKQRQAASTSGADPQLLYSHLLIAQLANKLINALQTISNAIVLVNSATETGWFKRLVSEATAVCFPYGRVKFYAPDGKTVQPLQGQAVLYFGENPEQPINAFGTKGWCTYSA